jgi:hypothetical protein
MSATTPSLELQRSRDELIALLEKKIGHMPEWKAFRAVERAIAAFKTPAPPVPPVSPTPSTNGAKSRTSRRPANSPTPYGILGLKALEITGLPVTTTEMIAFIGKHRELPADPNKTKANIVSALSHDDRFQSVAWRAGRAWWRANQAPPRPVSKEEATVAINKLLATS